MADIKGCKTICDCCGKETFRLYTGEEVLDGGYTRINNFEPLPNGWRSRSEIGMLCPDCNREFDILLEDFKRCGKLEAAQL